VAILPLQHTTSYRISRLLIKFNIKTVHIPVKKTSYMFRSRKNDFGLKVSGVYSIPCEWGKVCVRQTGQSIETRCQEHTRHLYQPDQSVVAQHSTERGHQIKFKDTEVLAKNLFPYLVLYYLSNRTLYILKYTMWYSNIMSYMFQHFYAIIKPLLVFYSPHKCG
jgi:hypothetical protein